MIVTLQTKAGAIVCQTDASTGLITLNTKGLIDTKLTQALLALVDVLNSLSADFDVNSITVS